MRSATEKITETLYICMYIHVLFVRSENQTGMPTNYIIHIHVILKRFEIYQLSTSWLLYAIISLAELNMLRQYKNILSQNHTRTKRAMQSTYIKDREIRYKL